MRFVLQSFFPPSVVMKVILKQLLYITWAGIAQSVWQLAKNLMVREQNPCTREFSAPVQTGPEAHTAPHKMGTGSLFWRLSGRYVAFTTHPHLAPRLKKK